MDRRQRKTRKAVLEAFEELISTERYQDITVQEIIDLADIGRTTFYANFETKDSVLDALCADLFDHIFEEHLPEEKTHDFSGAERSASSMLTHILYHLKEDKLRYGRLFTGESAELFWSRFSARFEGRLEDRAREWNGKGLHCLPDDLYMKLFLGSFVQIVTWWFGHGCTESPETIYSYLKEFCGLKD